MKGLLGESVLICSPSETGLLGKSDLQTVQKQMQKLFGFTCQLEVCLQKD